MRARVGMGEERKGVWILGKGKRVTNFVFV